MSKNKSIRLLLDELDRRQETGTPALFWLRDDDAVVPSEALSRFTAMTRRFSIPATVAVIPDNSGEALTEHLKPMSHVNIAVHGWSHKNHAPESEKKQELGSHRPIDETLAELSKGFKRLSDLHAERFVPLLVPPWNRIAPEIICGLSDIGFQGLSTFGLEKSAPIKMINTHVDLIDWKGTRGGRTSHQLIAEFVKTMHATEKPIGFLTHHLVHDEAAWAFMEDLFEATAKHRGCRWVSSEEILSGLSPNPRFPAE